MSKVTGNIQKNATEKTTKTGKKIIEFTIVESFPFTKDGVERNKLVFHNCVLWDNDRSASDFLANQPITVEGIQEPVSYVNKEGKFAASLKLTVTSVVDEPTAA